MLPLTALNLPQAAQEGGVLGFTIALIDDDDGGIEAAPWTLT